jgi:hypothetical protein
MLAARPVHFSVRDAVHGLLACKLKEVGHASVSLSICCFIGCRLERRACGREMRSGAPSVHLHNRAVAAMGAMNMDSAAPWRC